MKIEIKLRSETLQYEYFQLQIKIALVESQKKDDVAGEFRTVALKNVTSNKTVVARMNVNIRQIGYTKKKKHHLWQMTTTR